MYTDCVRCHCEFTLLNNHYTIFCVYIHSFIYHSFGFLNVCVCVSECVFESSKRRGKYNTINTKLRITHRAKLSSQIQSAINTNTHTQPMCTQTHYKYKYVVSGSPAANRLFWPRIKAGIFSVVHVRTVPTSGANHLTRASFESFRAIAIRTLVMVVFFFLLSHRN